LVPFSGKIEWSVLITAAVGAHHFGNAQLAKLVSRNNISVAANIYNVVISIIARIIYAVIVCLRNNIVITVYIAVVILIAVVVTITITGSVGIGIGIAGSRIVIAIAGAGLSGLAGNYYTAVGGLAVAAGNSNCVIGRTSSAVGVTRIKAGTTAGAWAAVTGPGVRTAAALGSKVCLGA